MSDRTTCRPVGTALALLLAAPDLCARQHVSAVELVFRELDVPAAQGSAEPNLFTNDEGDAWLTWIEPAERAAHALRFARLEGSAWSKPRTIAEGDDWFVNWADFPSLVALGGDVLAAHFLAKSADATFAYDVWITWSSDGGETWSAPVRPHTDGTPTEHGFVSMLPWKGASLLAVWLDGRLTGRGHGHASAGPMTLRSAVIDASGALSEEVELDGRVCDCCQTSAARTSDGAVVAYRDRTSREVRDVSVVRSTERGWSAPRPLHEDGWEIAGCPVDGPGIAARGSDVAAAWYTSAGARPRVLAASSTDGGEHFGPPVRVDDGFPVGRTDAVFLADGSVLVSWIERTADAAEIRVRRLTRAGERGESVTVAATSSARTSGFPRLDRSGDKLLVAWTDGTDPTRVHTAVALDESRPTDDTR